MTPAVGSDTTTAWGISGKIQYRTHNADRSKRGLLNVLPRTILAFPSEGKAKSARLAEQTHLAPNTETFSAVHFASVSCLSRLARSPGGSRGAEPH